VIDAIGFDCDDTLWHSEAAFHLTQERVRELLAPHTDAETLDRRLIEVERANLALYGYGAKAFTLSLIETAAELAGDRLTAADVQSLFDARKEILAHPVDLLPGARAALQHAVDTGLPVLLVTKGDLFHQESKVARSGLGELVSAVEVIHEKDESTYARVLRRNGIDPARFLMVGNSMRADIQPVLELGGHAAYVPYRRRAGARHRRMGGPCATRSAVGAGASRRRLTPAGFASVPGDELARGVGPVGRRAADRSVNDRYSWESDGASDHDTSPDLEHR